MNKMFLELISKLIVLPEVSDPKRSGVTRKMIPKYNFSIEVGSVFPLLYCKRSFIESAIKEFLFFINNETNISKLGASFWNDDAYNYYLRLHNEYSSGEPLSMQDFLINLGDPTDIPNYTYGDIGPVYGALWKKQVEYVIEQLQQSNYNTDMLVINSDYKNKNNNLERALPACHYAWQVLGTGKDTIGISFDMRSSDVFLGLPMNVLVYFLVGKYIEQKTGYKLNMIYGNLSNVHLYNNNFDKVHEILNGVQWYTAPKVPYNIEFYEGSDGKVKANFDMSIEYQEYKAIVPAISVPMLAQSNSLLK